jgi:hypothetical protein
MSRHYILKTESVDHTAVALDASNMLGHVLCSQGALRHTSNNHIASSGCARVLEQGFIVEQRRYTLPGSFRRGSFAG